MRPPLYTAHCSITRFVTRFVPEVKRMKRMKRSGERSGADEAEQSG